MWTVPGAGVVEADLPVVHLYGHQVRHDLTGGEVKSRCVLDQRVGRPGTRSDVRPQSARWRSTFSTTPDRPPQTGSRAHRDGEYDIGVSRDRRRRRHADRVTRVEHADRSQRRVVGADDGAGERVLIGLRGAAESVGGRERHAGVARRGVVVPYRSRRGDEVRRAVPGSCR